MTEIGGLCGLLSRRRRQPSGGGAHAEPVFPTKGEAATEGGAADTPWRLRRSCHPTQLVGATVYTNAPKRLREAVFADLCTLLHPHVCPQRCNSVHKCPETTSRGRFRRSVYTPVSPRPLARPGRPRVPRRRRPHGPRDTRVLGPETHAAGAVTQPPPHTNSQSFRKTDRLTGVLAGAEHLFCVSLVNLTCKHKEQGLMKQIDEQRMSAYESERTKTALKDPGG